VENYFSSLLAEVDRAYRVAEEARQVGLDAESHVEIPRAEDMAMRVEKLLQHLHIDGIAGEIRSLSEQFPREEVAVAIARRLATDPSRRGSVEERLDRALRVGLAILTEGILVAPLEGLAEVRLSAGAGGVPFVELYYAGPIRAAGGTAQALSVLLADVVRRDLALAAYQVLPDETERYKEEISLYKHFQHLQYVPTAFEIETIVRNVPVCISGEATEGDNEVSAFRNLARVPTNGIRGGACLVIAEGLCQKAAKLRKVVQKLGVPGWEFLERIGSSHGVSEENGRGPKYLAEAVGGRPVLAYPNRPGGFRLAYGRSRTAGVAACAINPATMVILRSFVAVGTQLKLEYPGKASAMALCDTVEGPIVELENGSVVAVHSASEAETVLPQVTRIIDLGEILVPFGEFLENNRALLPGDYSLDWHLAELEAAGVPSDEMRAQPSYSEAVETSRRWSVPLHPRFLLFWHDLSTAEIRSLSEFIEQAGRWEDGALVWPQAPEFRELLVRLGFLFQPAGPAEWRGEPDLSEALLGGLGLERNDERIVRARPLDPEGEGPLAYVSRLAGITVYPRAPSRVGARVGRPEKARQRKMTPNVHALLPVGEAGGPPRSIPEAARRTMSSGVAVELGVRKCTACGRPSVWPRCACGAHTEPTGATAVQSLPIAPLWAQALERLHLPRVPVVKGVKGLTSPGKVPELLEKGILRAFHGVAVYADGTARFDMTDLPLTHFRPREAGLSVVAARALGYVTDLAGDPLERDDQLLELKPQDLIVARSCGTYLLHLSQFVDDELVHLYNVPPFYRASRPEDLRGAVLVALAPHTSGGVAGRLIGFTEAEACFAHPLFHSAKRRNCDGDEDSVTLLMDALLNFSRAYLPQSRGALMDKPLVLTTRIDPTEVDKEAHNLDIAFRYPLGFYRAAARGAHPKEVEPAIEIVGSRLGSLTALEGYGFTHDTSDIAGGPTCSAYRKAGSMARIVEQSIVLTAQLRAVDVSDAVTLVLDHHFLPDLMGNLKSFATQKFRCKSCGTSYRRPPLCGRCTAERGLGRRCDGALLPTVFEGAVRKYLGLSQRLAQIEGVTPYLRQRLDILEASLATLFPGAPSQTTLDRFDTGALPGPSDPP
jgi:DNA polymerase II large subunit